MISSKRFLSVMVLQPASRDLQVAPRVDQSFTLRVGVPEVSWLTLAQ